MTYFRSFGNAIFSYRNSSSESKKKKKKRKLHTRPVFLFLHFSSNVIHAWNVKQIYASTHVYYIFGYFQAMQPRDKQKLIELQLKQRGTGYGVRAMRKREREREKEKRHGVSPLRMSVRAWSAMKRSTPDEPLPPPLFPHRNTRVIKSFHERNDP